MLNNVLFCIRKQNYIAANDIGDEISAYKAQYFYEPSEVSGLPSTSGTNVKSANDITSGWLQGLDGGNYIILEEMRIPLLHL